MDSQLAQSLNRALGTGYDVHCPRMPGEADPNVKTWKKKIASELSREPGAVTLVAHSVGGSILLRYLAEEEVQVPIAAVFMLAAPAWDEDRWNFEDLKLPRDVVKRLAPISRLFFYHCRDDDTVPFAHLALHHARIPGAVTRAFDTGGHQFADDRPSIATDIRGIEAV